MLQLRTGKYSFIPRKKDFLNQQVTSSLMRLAITPTIIWIYVGDIR